MSETEKLEPCPFCSGRKSRVIVTAVSSNRESERQAVFCEDCGCQGPGFWPKGDFDYSHYDKAIAAWNRRALPSRDDVLDVVEAECKRWDRNMGGDAGRSIWHYIVTATRALKKDQNNG